MKKLLITVVMIAVSCGRENQESTTKSDQDLGPVIDDIRVSANHPVFVQKALEYGAVAGTTALALFLLDPKLATRVKARIKSIENIAGLAAKRQDGHLDTLVKNAEDMKEAGSADKIEKIKFRRDREEIANGNRIALFLRNRFVADGLDQDYRLKERQWFHLHKSFDLDIDGVRHSTSKKSLFLPLVKIDTYNPQGKKLASIRTRPIENMFKAVEGIRKYDILDSNAKRIVGLYSRELAGGSKRNLVVSVHGVGDVNRKILSMELPSSVEGINDEWTMKIHDLKAYERLKEKLDPAIYFHFMALVSDSNYLNKNTKNRLNNLGDRRWWRGQKLFYTTSGMRRFNRLGE